GIPTVLDRFIQQLLRQAMTPIFARGSVTTATDFDPEEAQRTLCEPRRSSPARGRTGWLTLISLSSSTTSIPTIRDKRVLRLIGKFLRRGALVDEVVTAS